MKKIFTFALGFISLATIATAAPAKKTLNIENIFRLIVSDDINVILKDSPAGEITITGDEKFVSKVSYYSVNGVLTIKSTKGSLRNKVTVTVPVHNLQFLEVNDNCRVFTKGAIYSTLLKVKVRGEGRIDLKTIGQMVVEADRDIDLIFDRYENKPQADK